MCLWVYVEKEVPQHSSQDHPVFKCFTSLHAKKILPAHWEKCAGLRCWKFRVKYSITIKSGSGEHEQVCVSVWGEEKKPYMVERSRKIIRSHTHTHICVHTWADLYCRPGMHRLLTILICFCIVAFVVVFKSCKSWQYVRFSFLVVFFFFYFPPVCACVCAAQSGTETTTESSCTGRQQRTKAFQRALSLSFSICVTVRAYVWKRHLKRQRRKKYYLSKTKHWIPLTHFFGGYMVI